MSDDDDQVTTIDFIAPESSPGFVQCGARIAVPGQGDFPHCQLPLGHSAWHRWVHRLAGDVEGEVEYRWS